MVDDRRARKLAFYEELMLNNSEDTSDTRSNHDPRQQSGAQKKTQAENSSQNARRIGKPTSDTHSWKVQMAEMSQYVRANKRSWIEGAPEEVKHPRFSKSLDYEGFALAPDESHESPSTPIPWAKGYGTRRKPYTAADILDVEIEAFWKHMSLTNEERVARNKVRNLVFRCIRTKHGRADTKIYTYGSLATGLDLVYSDIDVGIYDPTDPGNDMEKIMEETVGILLRGSDFMCTVYRGPPHAIITTQHKVTGIEVQILAKGPPTWQDNYVREILESRPHLRELYAVVRTALGIRGLVDPYIGGISAYGTFMMVAGALGRRGTPSHVHKSRSAQLLHFLSFWSNFDMVKYGLAINRNGASKPFIKAPPNLSAADEAERERNVLAARRHFRPKRAGQYRIGRTQPRQPYMLCLQDPSNHTNDLGRNCHAIKHIQETIRAMHRDLVSSMEAYDEGRRMHGTSKDEQSILLPIVGRSHELYKERRERMTAKTLGSTPHDQSMNIAPETQKNGNKLENLVGILTSTSEGNQVDDTRHDAAPETPKENKKLKDQWELPERQKQGKNLLRKYVKSASNRKKKG